MARALKLLDAGEPALIGEVALACGSLWSLEDAEQLLKDLSREQLAERVPGVPVRYQRIRPVEKKPE